MRVSTVSPQFNRNYNFLENEEVFWYARVNAIPFHAFSIFFNSQKKSFNRLYALIEGLDRLLLQAVRISRRD